MASFSRAHSRAQSQTHSPPEESDASETPQPPIYACLERLNRSRLDTFKADDTRRSDYARIGGRDPTDPKTHANLMAELGKSFDSKQATDTQSRESDAEFSKELEAALKLIQDLESPNTIETPSEKLKSILDSAGGDSQDDSKTLSGHSSLDGRGLLSSSHGKSSCHLAVDSLSTSGYNSPSVSDRDTPAPESTMDCVIRNVGSTAVISIFPTNNEQRRHSRALSTGDAKLTEGGRLQVAMGKVRGLLRPRRPSLLPDLERAVLKSESLAFLTDGELNDRLEQTREVHRVCKEPGQTYIGAQLRLTY